VPRESVTIVYLAALIGLSAQALHSGLLLFLFLRHRREQASRTDPPLVGEAPWVTVQVPLRNEQYAVSDLLAAVAALEWPRSRLELQVLDDSDDETTLLAQEAVEQLRLQGLDASVLHRNEASGAKAGALAHGLLTARGEYVAIFDADFRPQPDFLVRTVSAFSQAPALGGVQARWGHSNVFDSLLTRAQALLLDVQFGVDHIARNRSHLLMNFNGTAGVWRRKAIEDAGGWQADTVCEDLDLSYRAQLAGWDMLYLPHVVVPAELPVTLRAFREQQRRWAKGAIQTFRKLALPILRSPRLRVVQKVMALMHLSGYFVQPLLLVLLLCSLILAVLAIDPPLWASPLGTLLALPTLLVIVAQGALYRDWPRRLLAFPVLLLLASGLSGSLLSGLWDGMRHWGGEFHRTPKIPSAAREAQVGATYRANNRLSAADAALLLLSLATLLVGLIRGAPQHLVLPLLYVLGTGWAIIDTLIARRGAKASVSRRTELHPGG